MNNVIDEVLSGEPRYTIKDSGGTTLYDNVQIDLKTAITTQGTPLNRALFESIRTDLNSRLLASNKATTQDVITGTNNTEYVTPQSLNSLITLTSREYASGETSIQTDTIITFNNNQGRMHIDGWLKGYASTGHGEVTPTMGAVILYINYNNGSEVRVAGADGTTSKNIKTTGFKIEIDFATKQFYLKCTQIQHLSNNNLFLLNKIV